MPGELVLVVDDEQNIQELCRLYLAREGYRVEVAADGRARYQAVLNSQPDLLILDVMLPGLDGFEICRRRRAEGATLPIVMLTARDEDIDKILGLELGFERFYQVDQSRKGGEAHGSGLGLAIAREIVQAHGGQITAESQLAHGSRFVVKLPVARPNDRSTSQSVMSPSGPQPIS